MCLKIDAFKFLIMREFDKYDCHFVQVITSKNLMNKNTTKQVSVTWDQSYKTFYVRNLRNLVMNCSLYYNNTVDS